MPTFRITPNIHNHVWAIQTKASFDLMFYAASQPDVTKSGTYGEWFLSLDTPRAELEARFGGFGRIEFVCPPDYVERVREAETALARALNEKYKLGTTKNYLLMVRNFWAAYPGVVPDALRATQARAFLKHLAEKHTSPAKLNLTVNALQFFLWKLTGTIVQLPRPATTQRRYNVLTRAEVETLLQKTTHPRDRMMILLAYGSGLRVAELCNLKPQDFDSHSGHVTVGDKASRKVPVSPRLQDKWPDFRRSCGNELWVFEGRDPARPMEVRTAQHAFRGVCSRVGLGRRATLQTLRHSYGVWLVANGRSNQEIMERMGLKSANAARIYRKWHDEMGREGPESPI